MKALTFHGKANIVYETVRDPEIEMPTDAIVKVDICAICGSDLHPYYELEQGLDHGTIMGHEFVGEIVEIGNDVRLLKKGLNVCSPFTTSCGQCFFCRKGLTARCVHGQLFGWVEKGHGLQGAQAEFVRVPMADSTLMVIPPDIMAEEALLLGDIFSTGYFCAANADIEAGDTCVVLGCGPVGLMAIVAAIDMGADKVLAVDTIPQRLAMARRFGAYIINYQLEDSVEVVRENTDGYGADAVLEVVGSSPAARMAFELVRPGGVISTVGVNTDTQITFSPAEAYNKNVTYRVGRCPARFYMEKLLSFVQKRQYDLLQVISHRIPLECGREAYGLFSNRIDGCIKAILIPE